MRSSFSRRWFVAAAGASVGTAALLRGGDSALGANILPAEPQSPSRPAVRLRAITRTLEINGKTATVMGLAQSNGTQGLALTANEPFNVLLENKLSMPTAIHWHGLHPPNNQDGVPGVTQPQIRANSATLYNFPVHPAGTHWMHSHLGLQEALLLSAPLIVHDTSEHQQDEQQVVLFLGDFSFTPPNEIFAGLRGGAQARMRAQPPSAAQGTPDINDVRYDAFLANDRTLHDPEVVRVERGARVRLRIINASSGTNFFIDLGALQGTLIATDGMAVWPVRGSRFPLAIAQRIDVMIEPPAGAFPILALREGAVEQTGIVLATPGARIKKLPTRNTTAVGTLNLALESRLRAVAPLPRKAIDKLHVLRLQGDMTKYEWPINGHVFDTAHPGTEVAQIKVTAGQRVGITFINETRMSHPMHLHGHAFQVVNINDRSVNGALRDTILVPPRTRLTVAFDANNPGLWFLHCHILWHLAAGMAVLVQYEA